MYVRLYDNLYTNYKNVFIFFFFLWFPVLIVKIFKWYFYFMYFDFTLPGLYLVFNNLLWTLLLPVETAFSKTIVLSY